VIRDIKPATVVNVHIRTGVRIFFLALATAAFLSPSYRYSSLYLEMRYTVLSTPIPTRIMGIIMVTVENDSLKIVTSPMATALEIITATIGSITPEKDLNIISNITTIPKIAKGRILTTSEKAVWAIS